MENQRLLECLDADFRRVCEVAAAADPSAPVESCPGWTMTDVLRHLGTVYLHKVECMRLGRDPDPWPPKELDDEPPLQLLERSYAALRAEFAARRPEDYAYSWYEPDQTVAFYIRRMAQETVIHRVDAEIGAGAAIAPIPADLGADGIDEVLVAFVQYGTSNWPEYFSYLGTCALDRAVGVVTPQQSWLVHLGSKDVRVEPSQAAHADAVVEGSAQDVLLWLWNRGQDAPTISGDKDAIALLRRVLVDSTQ